MSGNKEMINKINEISVTKNDLAKVLLESDRRHDEGTAEAGEALYVIVSLFSDNPEKGKAIYFRMMALARIVEGKKATGFTLPSKKNGAVLTKNELIEVAAVFPLSIKDGEVYFEPEGFLAKALELAEVEGNC